MPPLSVGELKLSHCFVIGPVLTERVAVADEDSVVSINGLDATEHYLIMVESRSASGVTSLQNSTIGVTMRGVDVDGAVMAMAILLTIIIVILVVAGVYSTWRYSKTLL